MAIAKREIQKVEAEVLLLFVAPGFGTDGLYIPFRRHAKEIYALYLELDPDTPADHLKFIRRVRMNPDWEVVVGEGKACYEFGVLPVEFAVNFGEA